jgi:hypothetical protein
MAASTARTVKDVNPHEFVKAYSAHLKRSGKVTRLNSLLDARCVSSRRGVLVRRRRFVLVTSL